MQHPHRFQLLFVLLVTALCGACTAVAGTAPVAGEFAQQGAPSVETLFTQFRQAAQESTEAAAAGQPVQAKVTAQNLNVRSGPSTTYAVADRAHIGDLLTVISQAAECAWLQVQLPSGEHGWVAGQYVELNALCTAVADADLPTAQGAAIPPIPAATMVSAVTTSEPTAATAQPIISTAAGDLKIVEIEISDRLLPGCANPPSLGCDLVKDGYKILILWLLPANGAPAQAGRDIFGAAEGTYIIGDDGVRVDLAGGGFTENKYLVFYTPAIDAHNFTLYWHDNPPLALQQ